MSSLSKGAPTNPELPDRLRDRVVAHIAPFFDDGIPRDQALAREAARQTLVCYQAATGRELQLSAQIVAFGMAALNCLSCSMTETDMPHEAMLRMQSNAVALNDMAEKSRKILEARQRERARGQAVTPEAIELDEAEFQAAIGKARQMVASARTQLEAHQVGKALAASAVRTSAKPDVTAADPVAPEAATRRQEAVDMWSRDLDRLTQAQGETRH